MATKRRKRPLLPDILIALAALLALQLVVIGVAFLLHLAANTDADSEGYCQAHPNNYSACH